MKSKILNQYGQYTDEFIEFLEHDAILKANDEYLKDYDCSCLDCRLISEYVIQELVLSGLKDRILNDNYQGWNHKNE